MSEPLTREIDELRLLMGSPRDPHGRVFAQLGDALRRAGSHREALSVLLDGVAEHPNFSPGHLVLGWTAQETGDWSVARAAFERTMELDPENPNALFGLGSLLDSEGDPRGAVLIEEAESLDARVREIAPVPASAADAVGVDLGGADPDLEHLPFLSLDELAPAGHTAGSESTGSGAAALADLPYVPLDELAPEGGESEMAQGSADGEESREAMETLPFVSLEELAPDATPGEATPEETAEAPADRATALDDLPFVSLEDLRPEPGQGGVPAGDASAEAALPEAGAVEPEATEAAPMEREAAEDHESADEEADGALDIGGPLATRTMGELLVRQGLMPEAVGVFEALVARSPEDTSLHERLEELRSELAAASDRTEPPGEVGEASPSHPGGEGPDRPGSGDERLDTSAHPSIDPPVPHPELPSPFHLDDHDADEAGEESGEAVGEYFGRLLAWTPARPEVREEPGEPAEGEGAGSS